MQIYIIHELIMIGAILYKLVGSMSSIIWIWFEFF